MATTLEQVREGLAANLAALKDVQVSAYMLSNPTPPTIHLYPSGSAGPIEYDQTYGGGIDLWPFTVQAFVGFTGDIAAQKNLDGFLSGSNSVKKAIEADRTLGGTVETLRVLRVNAYAIDTPEGRPPVLFAEWHVEVYIKRI